MVKKAQLNDPRVDDLTTSFFHKRDNVWTLAENDCHGQNNELGLQARFNSDMFWDWDVTGGTHWDTETAIAAPWAWAAAPFATPDSVELGSVPSHLLLKFQLGVAQRAFLYQTVAPGTAVVNVWLMGGMAALGTWPAGGAAWGWRFDDGTDNNYVEGGLATLYITLNGVANNSSRVVWRQWRAGGGAVNTWINAPGGEMLYPSMMQMIATPGGTRYTNWTTTMVLRGMSSSHNQALWAPNQYPPGMAFTPSRAGLVWEKPGTSTWFSLRVDAARVTNI